MSESSLLANVEFETVKKGYDPEQVDNYLHLLAEKVGQLQDMARHAVEQAELAQARLAEAERASATAEASAEQARNDLARSNADRPTADEGSEEGTEALKKMLMLAQRTADNHVEEAQASAKNIVADARTKSAEIVAGAETRAERLLIEAQKIADELVQERSANINSTIADLERRRDELQIDVEVLSQYLSEHRGRLQAGVDTLRSLLDDPRKFRAEATPELKAEPGTTVPAAPRPAPVPPQAAPPSTAAPTGSDLDSTPSTVADTDPSAASAPSPSSGSATSVRPSGAAMATASRGDQKAEFPAVQIPDLLETPPELTERMAADGAATQQIAMADQQALLDEASAGGDTLPPVDPSTDEAMRRFFEDDLDDTDHGRYRRR
jgi:DivIVA domain-containing protein